MANGRLFVVPTPIGNLEDWTFRAVRVLRQEVELALCEDTRTSRVLLEHYGIAIRCESYHAHNEHRKVPELIRRLEAGARMALLVDAGMPGISDPGFLLIRACLEANVPVEVLPGPTAFVPALLLSGLPCERFVFEGFLPARKGRRRRLEALRQEGRTIALYEAPHRLARTLQDLAQVLGPDRPAALIRELSKRFEEVRRGTLESLLRSVQAQPPRGEFVLVVAGKT
ncbi:MAG: 16S rRNA (cytidine(1402)-2'-O)-methyltransferase [Bacteroidetes bacterium]|nr:16S rRNA (cytidine(1402)-2'-O)-methyltransferase [Rhodothermia bacterium]MCX7907309.1 16S rRNA (cytidine(1402)-2'-O)-methyltransferase [Bacteroidota bacterium]MDW8286184.1 16S rRNA (cytidine(1402)-2'-O)-methyltransferase [Bacteroidota bacterium]